jgi:hypothetical protein
MNSFWVVWQPALGGNTVNQLKVVSSWISTASLAEARKTFFANAKELKEIADLHGTGKLDVVQVNRTKTRYNFCMPENVEI